MFPHGGTTIEELKSTGDSSCTIALGHFTSHPAATELDEKCGVGCAFLELPIGLTETDRFIHALRNYGGVDVPATIGDERGRLLDAMSDMHQYFHKKRVAIAGDPDHVIALTQFLSDLDMKPAYVITGSPGKHFEQRVTEILKDQVPDAVVKQNSDLFALHQWIKNAPVDLIIGNTYCKYIAGRRRFRLCASVSRCWIVWATAISLRWLHGCVAAHGENERRPARPQGP